MGADIHTTVGRVNKRIAGPTEPAAAEGTALAVFNDKRFRFGDFEFTSEIPHEVDLNRSYSLFSFLAGVRGSLKPVVPKNVLTEATEQFLKWLNDEHVRQLGKPQGWYSHEGDFIGDYAQYDVGEHSRVFYPVPVLLNFDYDQVAELENEGSDWRNPTYFRDPSGETYRQHIGDQLHTFLNWCVKENWQFVIFGFDN
jgi:hypothetical protein